jgi:hypothetical protein
VSEVPTNSAHTQLDSYSYTQSATPREWVPDTSAVNGGGELPGLLVLGPNMKTGANLIQFSSGATLTTQGSTDTGAIDVESSSAGSVNMVGNDTLKASGGLNIYNCASSGGTCTNSVLGTGTNNQTTQPVPASAVQDPLGLGKLTSPSFPAPVSQGVCTGPGGTLTTPISANYATITCTAGLYSSGLNVSGIHDTITFSNGGVSNAVFQFGNVCKKSKCATTGLTVAGTLDTLNFQNASYVFEGSISETNACTATGLDPNQGGISISGGSDTLQDNGAGVFFYVAGGPADFGCAVSTPNTIKLSPMTSGAAYPGILLFDNRANPELVVLDGFSTNGTIYAPDSGVESFGTGANTTGSLIVQDLDVAQTLTVA